LYFEYKLYRANRTTKISSEQFEAFASKNYPALAESGVHLNFNKNVLLKFIPFDQQLIVRKKLVTDVVILKLFPGITEMVVAAILNIKNLKGVVLETYGAGNAPNKPWFLDLIRKAIEDKIKVVNDTQCAGGSVLLGHYDTSIGLKSIGVISGIDMTTESAIAKLMYLLSEDLTNKSFKNYFQKSLRGEISEK
jgi:L-asparaginase